MLGQAKHPRAIVVLCVFMVVAIAAVAIFESSGGPVSSSVDSKAQIQTDFTNHLADIRTMNITTIEQDYTSDARIQFLAGDLNNSYSGIKGVVIGYQADVFPYFAVPQFSNFNTTVKVDGKSATVNATFVISGYDSDDLSQAAQVSAQIVYVLEGQTWLISFESWHLFFAPGSTDESNGGQ
jgi:hypothetical protein